MPTQPPTLDYQPPEQKSFAWERFISVRIYLIVGKLTVAYLIATMFVIPRFATIFADFGLQLPWITQLVIDLAALQRKYAITYAIIPLAVLVAIGLSMLSWRGSRIESLAPRKWIARALWLLLILLLVILIFAMFTQMSVLISGVTGSKK